MFVLHEIETGNVYIYVVKYSNPKIYNAFYLLKRRHAYSVNDLLDGVKTNDS